MVEYNYNNAYHGVYSYSVMLSNLVRLKRTRLTKSIVWIWVRLQLFLFVLAFAIFFFFFRKLIVLIEFKK